MPWFNSNDNIIPARSPEGNFVDQSDAYANKFRTFISFLHIPSDQRVYFKAMITTFSDSFSSQWSGEEVYGRADPIQIFKSTKRSITLGFDVVASTDGEAFTNLARLQSLAQFLYPSYTNVSQAQTIAQSPLVRVGFMNIITDNSEYNTFDNDSGRKGGDDTAFNTGFNNDVENGLVCAITSLNYSSMGFEKDNSNTLVGKGSAIPRVINVSLNLEPIHRHSIGWTEDGFARKENGTVPYGFPYAIQDPQSVHRANKLLNIRPSPSYDNRTHKATYTGGILNEATKAGEGGDKDAPAAYTTRMIEALEKGGFLDPTEVLGSRKPKDVQNLQSGMERLNQIRTDLNIRQSNLQQTQQQIDMANARYNSLGGRIRYNRDMSNDVFNMNTAIGRNQYKRKSLALDYRDQDTLLSDASKPIDPRGSLKKVDE